MIYLSVLLNIISLYVVFELWQRIRALRNHNERLKREAAPREVVGRWAFDLSDWKYISKQTNEAEEPKRSGAW